ncbi:MAG: NAD-dependent epimerase/dehydratase family protein [Desulfatibacillaceae bacterium]
MVDLYLVTGGCGFIGSHLAETLLSRGGRVRILDNLATGSEANIAGFRDSVEFVTGDVRNPADVAAAMDGVCRVFHLAAQVSPFVSVDDPVYNHEVNSTGTLNVLCAARNAGARRVVFSSSCAVYGNNPDLPKREDMAPESESPYAASKHAGEQYLASFARVTDLSCASLRFFNVYGPRQDPGSVYSGVISRFHDCFANDKQPIVFGDGLQTRDFVYVADVVQALCAAMEDSAPGSGEVYNVGTGRATSLRDLLAAFSAITGKSPDTSFEPARTGDIRHSVADIAKAAADLGYAPRHTVEQGLRELVEHG